MGILVGRGGIFGLYVYFTSSLFLASLSQRGNMEKPILVKV